MLEWKKEYEVGVLFVDEQHKKLFEIGYRRFLSHKIEHDEFIKKVNNIDFKSVDHHQDKYIKGILEFIYKWIEEHILIKDMEYVEKE